MRYWSHNHEETMFDIPGYIENEIIGYCFIYWDDEIIKLWFSDNRPNKHAKQLWLIENKSKVTKKTVWVYVGEVSATCHFLLS